MIEYHEFFPQETGRSLNLILLVTKDAEIGLFLQRVINSQTRYHVILAANAQQAVRILQEIKPDLFLLDYELARKDGFALYERLHATKGCEGVPAMLSPLSTRFPPRPVKPPSLGGEAPSSELESLLSALEELLV